MTERTLSIMQAAAAAGVSRRSIYNWLKAGKLRWIRTAGGAIRIYEDSLFRPGEEWPQREEEIR